MIRNNYLLTKNFFCLDNLSFGPSFWAFCILNLPSLKILYASEVVNILVIICLFFTYFLNSSKILIGKNRIKCFVIFSLLWAILLIYGFFGVDAVVSTEIFLRYASVYFAVVGLIFFITEKDLPKIIFWQIIWGAILSVYQISFGFTFGKSSGIHYNTVAIPIACSLLIITGLLFFTKRIANKKLDIIILWSCLILNILSVTTLEGRGPLLYSLLVSIIFLLSKKNYWNFLKGYNILQVLRILMAASVLIYIGYVNLQSKLSDWGIERYYRLIYETQEEGRIQLYKAAIKVIIDNPFGYGLNAADKLIGFYPHNIFLEVLISAGIIGIIPFLIFVIFSLKAIIDTVKTSSYHVPFAMMSLYLFFTWNTSFDLASSYICLGAMAIVFCTKNKNKPNNILKYRKNNKQLI